MVGGRRRRSVMIGLSIIGLLVGAAILAPTVTPPHPGEVHYQAYCAECHDRDGVLAILEQRADEAEQLLVAAHVERHAADPDQRAQLIAYLKSEIGADPNPPATRRQ